MCIVKALPLRKKVYVKMISNEFICMFYENKKGLEQHEGEGLSMTVVATCNMQHNVSKLQKDANNSTVHD